ncbi:MAG: LysR substrate-binding domain-containing protein [Sphingobium sp.]
MDLRHLRYFLYVAEELHFSRAAQRLGISQPPLSQQVRALEEELGVRLFDRTSRRVRLTDAGRLFEPEARRTLAQAERAMQVALRAQRGDVGQLALGFTTSAPFVPCIAGALYRYRQLYPDVAMTLNELGRDQQIAALANGQLDIGVLRDFPAPALPDGMVAHRLLTEDMVLALRDDHRLAIAAANPSIADLAEEPMVLYGAPTGTGFNEHFMILCEQEGFAPRIAHAAQSLATLLGLVSAGFGPTIVPRSMARLHVDNIVNRTFDRPFASSLWLIHNADLSTTGAAFRDTVLAEAMAPR